MEERQRLTPILTPRVLWISNRADEIVDSVRLSLVSAGNALDGLSLLRSQDFDAVLLSLPVPDRAWAAGLLEELQQTQPGTPVVIHAPDCRPTDIVGLLRLGAFHVFEHGDATSLLYIAANTKRAAEYAAIPGDREAEPWRRLLIGESRAVQQIAQCIRLVAPRRSTVLITGETGTGK